MFLNESEGFEAYKTYLAIKQHFTKESYDFFKYDGKVRAKKDTFKKRNDKYFFSKLNRNYSGDDLIWFLVANFITGQDVWIGNLVNQPEYHSNYIKTKRTIESLEYTFGKDLQTLVDLCDNQLDFNRMFKVVDNKHPAIVKFVLQNKIQIETFILMDCVIGCIDRIDAVLDEPYIWGNLKKRCRKYKPFLIDDEDIPKFGKIMKDVVMQIANTTT